MNTCATGARTYHFNNRSRRGAGCWCRPACLYWRINAEPILELLPAIWDLINTSLRLVQALRLMMLLLIISLQDNHRQWGHRQPLALPDTQQIRRQHPRRHWVHRHIIAPAIGTYTVGAGGNFSQHWRLRFMVPIISVVLEVTGYIQFDRCRLSWWTFPITINSNSSASAVNTLTIKPTLPGTVISGSSLLHLLLILMAPTLLPSMKYK